MMSFSFTTTFYPTEKGEQVLKKLLSRGKVGNKLHKVKNENEHGFFLRLTHTLLCMHTWFGHLLRPVLSTRRLL